MSDPNSDYLEALASGEDPQDAASRVFRGIHRHAGSVMGRRHDARRDEDVKRDEREPENHY